MRSVSVIIPHAGGREILRDCLNSLAACTGVRLEAIIVDNSDVTDIDDALLSSLETVQILRYECKLGFAGACNRGVESATSEYVLLLNNDTIVEPDSISILAEKIAAHPEVGACQPKLLSLRKPGYFDYSSACGGEMDRYGYPFARGRIFDHLERDNGQYDDAREMFWGAGAALMIRRDLYLEAGGLEESFFAHMEEIDLLWRVQLMGFTVAVYPQAVIRHKGAATLQTGSFLKLFLNHRNSLSTLFRNYAPLSLVRYLPVRVVLDVALSLYSVFRLDFLRFWAVFRAELWFWSHLAYLMRQRKEVQRLRWVREDVILKRLYPKSVVWQSFIRQRNTWAELQIG